MNGLRLVLILGAIIAIIGIGGYFFVKRSQNTTDANNATISSPFPSGNHDVPGEANINMNNIPSREIIVEASEYKFTPSEVKVKKGETVKITLKNSGKMNHNWMVEKMGGASIDTTQAGSTNSIVVTPSQKGTFTTFCSVGSHRSLGMVGKLVVE